MAFWWHDLRKTSTFSTFLHLFRWISLLFVNVRCSASQSEYFTKKLRFQTQKTHRFGRILVFPRSEPSSSVAGQENGLIWMAPIDQKWWVLPWYQFWGKSAASRGLPQIVSPAGDGLNKICYNYSSVFFLPRLKQVFFFAAAQSRL